MSTTIADRVQALAAPICADLGVGLYDVEHNGGIVRVSVERIGGVDIDTIARITRELSRALDQADPVPGRYLLEVSSPGLERPLRRPAHFLQAVGEIVNIKTRPHVEGERRFRAELRDANNTNIVIVVDGETRQLDYDDIEKATTVFEWGPAPKPGKSPSGSAPRRGTTKVEQGPAKTTKVVNA